MTEEEIEQLREVLKKSRACACGALCLSFDANLKIRDAVPKLIDELQRLQIEHRMRGKVIADWEDYIVGLATETGQLRDALFKATEALGDITGMDPANVTVTATASRAYEEARFTLESSNLKTGFDRYFDEQMEDPEIRAAYEVARAEIKEGEG